MKKVITIELRLKEIAEEMPSDPSYFIEEIKEFFEQYGWLVVWNSVEDEGD